MRRYWIKPSQIQNTQGTIDGDEFHHIVDVCRQTKGSRFEVLTEGHKAFFVELTEVSKRSAQFQILEERNIPALPLPRIHLCLSVPRFPVFENVIEKMVELGAFDIQLFFSEHSFVRTKDKISRDKFERWSRIVKSSTQQSGRGDLMALHEPLDLATLLDQFNQKPHSACLFAYEGDSQGLIQSTTLSTAIEKIDWNSLEDLYLFVGSEGGFSTQEANFMREKGYNPVNMGQQILRVETACVALVSILKYEAQRR
jgi:16S rRNA (uracil1498-N3)-methyltransferase